MVTLCGKEVGQIGFGLMQLTWNPHPASEEVQMAAMKAAVDAGATAWSSANFYGNPGGHELDNLKMIAKFFDKYPEYLDKVVVVVKGRLGAQTNPTYEELKKEVEEAKVVLGKKKLDAFSIARLPPKGDHDELYKMLAKLRDEGVVEHIAASEASRASLEKMAKYVPVSCIEIEVSLWSYEQDIQDAIAYSKENKIPVFAYSPLARGFIGRQFKKPEDIPDGDFRKGLPRFQGEAFYQNLKLVDQLDEISKKKGISTSELAIAWVAQINPYNIPIPGSSNPDRIKSNTSAGDIKLTEEEMGSLQRILDTFKPAGDRYMAGLHSMSMQ